ncbi:MAG: hypothetical protein ACK5KO_09735, partial [Arachnia sp.]
MKLVRVLVRAAVVLALVLAAPVPHAAADTTPLVSVRIEAISSPVLEVTDPSQVVQLSGTLTNDSDQDITYTAVNFWSSGTALETPSDVAEALISDNNDPIGTRTQPSSEESGHVQVLTRADPLKPGQTMEFSVSATISELGFTQPEAAYLVGVHITGIPAEGGRQVVGRGRLLAVSDSEATASVVVKLTAPPAQAVDGNFLNNSLASDLTGRLDQLLATAETPGAMALIDPSLIDEVAALAEEHLLRGEPVAGLPAAESWLERVEALEAEDRVLRLPYADPDLAAAFAEGRLADLFSVDATLTADSPLRDAPLAADVSDQGTTELTEALETAGVQLIFADNALSGSTGEAMVFQASALTAPGMGPGDRTTQAQQIGRLLAEETLAAEPRAYVLREPAELPARELHTYVPLQAPQTPPRYADVATGASERTAVTGRVNESLRQAEFVEDLTGVSTVADLTVVAAKAYSSQFTTQDDALAYVEANPVADIDPDAVQIS